MHLTETRFPKKRCFGAFNIIYLEMQQLEISSFAKTQRAKGGEFYEDYSGILMILRRWEISPNLEFGAIVAFNP